MSREGRLTHADSMQKCDKKAATLAYVEKKQYLCTRKGAMHVKSLNR